MVKLSFEEEESAVTRIIAENAGLRLKVYPNPAKETLNIHVDNEQGIVHVAVYDLTGRKLTDHQYFNSPGGTASAIDLSAVGTGYYLLKITSPSGKTEFTKFTHTR